MPRYRILTSDSSDLRAVKVGFSWPAFLLNLIRLVANGLWLGALLISVLFVGGFLLSSSAVQSSPVAASAGFVSAVIALLVYLGIRGNDWLASHLESRGYTHACTLDATNFENALELATSDQLNGRTHR